MWAYQMDRLSMPIEEIYHIMRNVQRYFGTGYIIRRTGTSSGAFQQRNVQRTGTSNGRERVKYMVKRKKIYIWNFYSKNNFKILTCWLR